ncbi:hypothetical protein [Thermus filiformis]|uniref:hypothetical protein n=1 Tax=Thermus filiformis TaxID=276 RepID=UPI00069D92A8|nr:hypothetical protein [Thermus filiformis]
MKGFKLLLAVPLALALSSCSDVFLKNTPYQVMLEPAQLGYEVDDQGKITVVGNTAYVQVDAGAPGGYLVGYEYVVVDDSGNEFLPGSSLGSGSLAVEVPPGREEVNGQWVYVPKRSEAFRFLRVLLDLPLLIVAKGGVPWDPTVSTPFTILTQKPPWSPYTSG